MKYLALYRKYRPAFFNDFFGQKHIVEIIKNSILKDKISHAYLFSGPRGTGKTSMAKLIAKTVNCESIDGVKNCEKCNSCKMINEKANPDIIEIDAASNNGVDEIRELRDKVSLMPSVSKYKIYIIDEVHMLTNSAFNALLKTLEEPPSHVIFILATTELYKVPETIVSRCQCFEFNPISSNDIEKCLENIAKKEKFKVDNEVFSLIANYSKGGLRDAIGILDKLSSCADKIDSKLFYEIIGVASDENVDKVLTLILDQKTKEVLTEIDNLAKNGTNLVYFIEQIALKVRNNVIENGEISREEEIILKELNDLLIDIKFSFNYLLSIELGILNLMAKLKEKNDVIAKEIIVTSESNNKLENKEKDEKNEQKSEQKNEQVIVDSVGINNAFALADKELKNSILNKWKDFNDYVHNKEFSSVVSCLLDSKLEVAGKEDLIISLPNEAAVKNAIFNKIKLELLLNLVIGKFYNLVFVSENYANELKQKYINDVKNGKEYKYQNKDEKIETNDDIIKEEDTNDAKVSKDAKDVFGSDIVEIR